MDLKQIVYCILALATQTTFPVVRLALKGIDKNNPAKIFINRQVTVVLDVHDPYIVPLEEGEAHSIEFQDNNNDLFVLSTELLKNVVHLVLTQAETGKIFVTASKPIDQEADITLTIPLQTELKKDGAMRIEPSQETIEAIKRLEKMR